jgi:hypothetical protein
MDSYHYGGCLLVASIVHTSGIDYSQSMMSVAPAKNKTRRDETNNKKQENSDLHLQLCSWVYTLDHERSTTRREKKLTHVNAENQFSYALQQLEAYICPETMASELSSRGKTPELLYKTRTTNLSQKRSSLRIGWRMRSRLTVMVRETDIYIFCLECLLFQDRCIATAEKQASQENPILRTRRKHRKHRKQKIFLFYVTFQNPPTFT